MTNDEEMILAIGVVLFLVWVACHAGPPSSGPVPVAGGAIGLTGSTPIPETGNTGNSQIFRGQTSAFFGAFQPSCGNGCNCQ